MLTGDDNADRCLFVMSILEEFPTLSSAIAQKTIVFIINVDVFEGLEGLNEALAAINHPDITVVIASSHSIDHTQMLFREHKNFIANHGFFVKIGDHFFRHARPNYTAIQQQLDAFAEDIGVNKSVLDGYFLNLLISATHDRYADVIELAERLVEGSELTVTATHTSSFQGIRIGSPNPDGMWSGFPDALNWLRYDPPNNRFDNLSNPLVVYMGECNSDNIVAMVRVKERGGFSIAVGPEQSGRSIAVAPDPERAAWKRLFQRIKSNRSSVNATLDNRAAFIPFCREIAGLLSRA